MTKEDREFFTGLIKGLADRLDGHDKRFDSIDKRFDGLEGRFDGLEGRFDGLEAKVEQNSRDIRSNGMQIELMRDDISLIGERDSFYADMRAKVEAMYEVITIDIPAIKQAVSSHSKRITALEAKCT